MINIKRLPEGLAYLNVGCGNCYFPEWTNIDMAPDRGVRAHDLRRPLPFNGNSFDAVYSSHVLEHLTPSAAKQLLREKYRVLKVGGICRIVVPDLEMICREYLRCLDEAVAKPSEKNKAQYQWMILELLDQMVRDKSGGLMRETLVRRDFDASFVKSRMGEQFQKYYKTPTKKNTFRDFFRKVRRAVKSLIHSTDPRKNGEVHRWMYDRLSLRLLVEEVGFECATVKTFDQSEIPFWGKYNLDKSKISDRPRKPDSLFFECRKLA